MARAPKKSAFDNFPFARRSPILARRIYGSLLVLYGATGTLLGLLMLGASRYGPGALGAGWDLLVRTLLTVIGLLLTGAGIAVHEAANARQRGLDLGPRRGLEDLHLRFLYHWLLRPAALLACAYWLATSATDARGWTVVLAAGVVVATIALPLSMWRQREAATSVWRQRLRARPMRSRPPAPTAS